MLSDLDYTTNLNMISRVLSGDGSREFEFLTNKVTQYQAILPFTDTIFQLFKMAYKELQVQLADKRKDSQYIANLMKAMESFAVARGSLAIILTVGDRLWEDVGAQMRLDNLEKVKANKPKKKSPSTSRKKPNKKTVKKATQSRHRTSRKTTRKK